jgi:hypothetical protein
VNTERENDPLVSALILMLDRQEYLAELRERQKFERRLKRQRKVESESVRKGQAIA